MLLDYIFGKDSINITRECLSAQCTDKSLLLFVPLYVFNVDGYKQLIHIEHESTLAPGTAPGSRLTQ